MRLAEALQAKLVELELAEREVTDADVQEVLSGLKRFQQTLRVLDQKVTEATIPINETLPIAIYMRLASADIEGTAALVLILIGIGLGILYGVRFFFRDKASYS